MNSPSPLALEKSLKRKISGTPAIVSDASQFEELCAPYFSKSSAIKAMKAYLAGRDSAPKVLGCLIYSKAGRSELHSWIEAGMPATLLYRSMLHDGGPWKDGNPGFALQEAIIAGDDRWDFDYRLLTDSIFPEAVVPGFMEAIVKRAVHRGQIKQMVSILPQRALSALIAAFPQAFAEISDYPQKESKPTPVEIARAICAHWLPPERSIMKMLLHSA